MATDVLDDATERRREDLMSGVGCALVVAFIALGLAGFPWNWSYFNNPARWRTEEEIHAEILAETPIGKRRSDVEEYVSKRWNKPAIPFAEDDASGKTRKGIFWQYGRYTDLHNPAIEFNVVIKWYFNDKDRLEEIAVDKHSGGA